MNSSRTSSRYYPSAIDSGSRSKQPNKLCSCKRVHLRVCNDCRWTTVSLIEQVFLGLRIQDRLLSLLVMIVGVVIGEYARVYNMRLTLSASMAFPSVSHDFSAHLRSIPCFSDRYWPHSNDAAYPCGMRRYLRYFPTYRTGIILIVSHEPFKILDLHWNYSILGPWRYGVQLATNKKSLEERFIPQFLLLSLLGLFYTILVMFAYQGYHIIGTSLQSFRTP